MTDPHITAARYLLAAARRLNDGGWVQGSDAVTASGTAVRPEAEDAVSFCLRGALLSERNKALKLTDDEAFTQAWRALGAVTGTEPIAYNDEPRRKKSNVIGACRKAAKLLALGPLEAIAAPIADIRVTPGCQCDQCMQARADPQYVMVGEAAGYVAIPRPPKALRAAGHMLPLPLGVAAPHMGDPKPEPEEPNHEPAEEEPVGDPPAPGPNEVKTIKELMAPIRKAMQAPEKTKVLEDA